MALGVERFLEVTLQGALPADIAGEAVECSGEDEVGLPECDGNRPEAPIFELRDESLLVSLHDNAPLVQHQEVQMIPGKRLVLGMRRGHGF